jgi:predicted NodU family carbamoyl transferase
MIILGINTHHDGSVSVVKDGRLLGAISTERITKNKKQDGITKEFIYSTPDVNTWDIYEKCLTSDTAANIGIANSGA